MSTLRRIHLFLGLVFRPVTGPAPGEHWTWWERNVAIRISPRLAWEVACILEP